MLGLNFSNIKILFNPQNIYDGLIFGLNYMPSKSVTVATAAITGGVALYLTQPETVFSRVSVVIIALGLGWGTTEVAHRIGSMLWRKRLAELEIKYKEHERTPEGIEIKRRIEEVNNRLLEQLFTNPEEFAESIHNVGATKSHVY
jgi:hypothetical protein